jgi:hypothetical protein
LKDAGRAYPNHGFVKIAGGIFRQLGPNPGNCRLRVSQRTMDPQDYAISRFSIPLPARTEGGTRHTVFQVEQSSPFAAISSIFDQNQSANGGFRRNGAASPGPCSCVARETVLTPIINQIFTKFPY